jgi:hypothetical protein
MLHPNAVCLNKQMKLALNLAAWRKNDFEKHPPPSFDPVPVAEQESNPTIEQSAT